MTRFPARLKTRQRFCASGSPATSEIEVLASDLGDDFPPAERLKLERAGVTLRHQKVVWDAIQESLRQTVIAQTGSPSLFDQAKSMRNRYLSALTALFLLSALGSIANSQDKADKFVEGRPYRMPAAGAAVNSASSAVVSDKRLEGNQGVTLKPDAKAALDGQRSKADLTFDLKAPAAGLYVMSTYAVVDDEGAKLMKEARGKYDSLFMTIQIDDRRPTKRVVYVPWNRPRQTTGMFDLSGEAQQLKIWLPRGVRLGYVEWRMYSPPAVPKEARDYKPQVVPPAERPRLWVNQETLPVVKSRLAADEHQAAWDKVAKSARKPFDFQFDPDKEVAHNAELETAVRRKAFYYLMTGDEKVGREAVALTTDYLSHVEFGNILDITREMGRAIYTASLVYDWCYDLLSQDDKDLLHKHLMRLARDMECGWPPFRQSIVNGHGNEAMINRDLLAMSIALYGDDSQPYQYASYIILEQLVPMRKFEYQSPRHDQGVNYGAYRFGWEMHAAWFFHRMLGKPVFDENIKGVRRFWQYMRLPDGQMLRDGDGFSSGYWRHPRTMLLMYAYANDPMLKAEFERQGGLPNEPILYLLLNDPKLEPVESQDSLPLTIDFGPILGSMIARTGWNMGDGSNDVVAEIKGGGYHFGNHQHSDAGSLQIYYRGLQVADLGMYKFYGTPYDYNFNKRSIAHSMMLARDPNEKFGRGDANDGGTRFNQRYPRTPAQAKKDKRFHNGTVVSAAFGPSRQTPTFSYFKADLTSAYSNKMEQYSRGFCFINLGGDDIPAAVILSDDMTTAKPEFRKYWQINTLNPPVTTGESIVLYNQRGDLVGKTHVRMLLPAPEQRQLEILSGAKANSVFGKVYEPPSTRLPEASGSRIMISPKESNARDRFLTVFQMVDGQTKPIEVKWQETESCDVITLANKVVVMSKSSGLIEDPFSFDIAVGKESEVALTGIAPGAWVVKSADGKLELTEEVRPGENVLFFTAGDGKYSVAPRAEVGHE